MAWRDIPKHSQPCAKQVCLSTPHLQWVRSGAGLEAFGRPTCLIFADLCSRRGGKDNAVAHLEALRGTETERHSARSEGALVLGGLPAQAAGPEATRACGAVKVLGVDPRHAMPVNPSFKATRSKERASEQEKKARAKASEQEIARLGNPPTPRKERE